jgi:hypothetical protein
MMAVMTLSVGMRVFGVAHRHAKVTMLSGRKRPRLDVVRFY